MIDIASVKFGKGTKEWEMFSDYYQLIQKYYIPENKDDYWDNVVEEMDGFCEKYKQVPLARKIAMAFLKTMEEELKKGKNEKL